MLESPVAANEEQLAPRGVYIGASSKEMDRAKHWMDKLREKGIHVTSTWIEVINTEGKGEANPREATREEKQKWCQTDVREALMSQVYWLLMPKGEHSFGATFEFTMFVALSNEELQSHIVSGDYKRSIFTSFSACFDTDEEAFVQIVEAFAEYEKAAQAEAAPAPAPAAP